MKSRLPKGFTLLEILLVIAAIGILAAIVIIAINPTRQLAQARDAERISEINSLQKALEQYLIDTGGYPAGITNTYSEVCATGSNEEGQGIINGGCLDLRPLVPIYLSSIPEDPSAGTPESGYFAGINNENNKIGIYATGELTSTISINYNDEGEIVEDNLVTLLDAGDTASYLGTGTTWTDLSSNALSGTLVNGVSFGSDFGGVLTFNGVNQRAVFPTTPIVSTDAITVSAWVRTTQSGYRWIAGKYSSLGDAGWHLIMNSGAAGLQR